jgi:hypothetical protein
LRGPLLRIKICLLFVKAFFLKGGICIRNNALHLGHWARDYGKILLKSKLDSIRDLQQV